MNTVCKPASPDRRIRSMPVICGIRMSTIAASKRSVRSLSSAAGASVISTGGSKPQSAHGKACAVEYSAIGSSSTIRMRYILVLLAPERLHREYVQKLMKAILFSRKVFLL